MSIEYKKYTVSSKNGDVASFHAFSSVASYENQKTEIFSWLEKLAASANMTNHEILVEDASWTTATINDNFLFEKHQPN